MGESNTPAFVSILKNGSFTRRTEDSVTPDPTPMRVSHTVGRVLPEKETRALLRRPVLVCVWRVRCAVRGAHPGLPQPTPQLTTPARVRVLF
eukprot:3734138-Prymnesium_polylepis.1